MFMHRHVCMHIQCKVMHHSNTCTGASVSQSTNSRSFLSTMHRCIPIKHLFPNSCIPGSAKQDWSAVGVRVQRGLVGVRVHRLAAAVCKAVLSDKPLSIAESAVVAEISSSSFLLPAEDNEHCNQGEFGTRWQRTSCTRPKLFCPSRQECFLFSELLDLCNCSRRTFRNMYSQWCDGLRTWAGLVLPRLAYCWVVTQAGAITFCVKTPQGTKGEA